MEPSRTPPTSLQQWMLLCATLWFMTGVTLDGWAHNHIAELETFFTPWHAILYSGFALAAAVLIGIVLSNRSKRRCSFSEAIPLGYGWALIGVVLFAAGGAGDLLWHEIFGIESGLEPLLSPTHLLLATGGFLINTGNLRAWLLNRKTIISLKWMDHVPVIFSGACGLMAVNFMAQYSHYVVIRAGGAFPGIEAADTMQMIAITGFLFHTCTLMGTILIMLRHGKLPFGAFTLLLGINTLALGWMKDGLFLLPSGVATGLIADYFARTMVPFEKHARQLRLYSFAVPTTLFSTYFLTIALREGIWWSVHMWTGSIVMAGLAGLLLSYAFLPPKESASLRG